MVNETFGYKKLMLGNGKNARVSGVLYGIHATTNLNVNFLRSLFLVITFFSGFTAILVYIFASWIIDDYDSKYDRSVIQKKKVKVKKKAVVIDI